MLTLWYFLRRLFCSIIPLLILICWIPLAIFSFQECLTENQFPYAAIGVGLAIYALFCIFRVVIAYRPRYAGIVSRVILGDTSLIGNPAENLPDDIGLLPVENPRFRKPREVQRAMNDLASRGFEEVGKFSIVMERSVPMVLMANSTDNARVTLFEAEGAKLESEFVSEYPNDQWFGCCNAHDRGLTPRANHPTVRLPGAGPVETWNHFLAERPREGLATITKENAADSFVRDTNGWLRWRKEHGFTQDEIWAMHAPIVKMTLNLLCFGTPYIALCALLIGRWTWLARTQLNIDFSKDSLGIFVGSGMIFLAMMPLLIGCFIYLRKSFRSVAAQKGVEGFTPRLVSDLENSNVPEEVHEVQMRDFGFRKVGLYDSPAGRFGLWLRQSESTYAIVWSADRRPWVELIVAFEDGGHFRATPLVSGADGNVTVDRSSISDFPTLYVRGKTGAGAAPRAALTDENVLKLSMTHLRGDREWQEHVIKAAAQIDSEWTRSIAFRKLFAANLWKAALYSLPMFILIGVFIALTLNLDDDVLNSRWFSGIWLIFFFAILLFPQLRDSFQEARKKVAERRARMNDETQTKPPV